MKIAFLLAFTLLAGMGLAQTDPPPVSTTDTAAAKSPPPKKTRTQPTAAQLQAALDQLTQSNRDLLDLLKRQQTVLQDMQFDRRLQSRQIQSLEERLTNTLYENTELQKQIAALQTTVSLHAAAPAPLAAAPASTNAPPPPTPPAPVVPPKPASFLPPPDTEGAPGTMSWHRILVLKGTDGQQSNLFHITGKTWRVIWHNQDREGKVYQNTSALFINAFPRDDTIPQKACAKLGTGGDKTELIGPGNFYLKIEASGGSWELAVEDFR